MHAACVLLCSYCATARKHRQNPTSKNQRKASDSVGWGYSHPIRRAIMKTIHPLELEAKIEANETVEILDLRPRCQFETRHVPGSHSLPFNEFDAEALVHARELPLPEPLYLISERSEQARIAAGSMAHRGLDNLIVVEGGLANWERNGLPVDRRRGQQFG
jgi:rhodanese-related sulfurtransferase